MEETGEGKKGSVQGLVDLPIFQMRTNAHKKSSFRAQEAENTAQKTVHVSARQRTSAQKSVHVSLGDKESRWMQSGNIDLRPFSQRRKI